MTRTRRRPRLGANLPFHRLAAITLMLAAALPAGVLGGLVYVQIERALATDAAERTDLAVDAASGQVAQAGRDLQQLARSYANWPTFGSMTQAGKLDAIRDDVLAFLVERGSVTAGLVETPAGRAVAGDPDVSGLLTRWLGDAGSGPVVATIGGAVFLLDAEAVASPDADGTALGTILLARRLDARFTADIARLTGFSVALLTADGEVAVSTDPAMTGAVAEASGSHPGVVRVGELVARRLPLSAGDNRVEVLLATRLSALQATAGSLPVLVLGLLGLTALLAALLAFSLSRVLNRRLDVIHDGLAAVADGRVPPAHVAGSGDEVARLAAGLDRLVGTLDRREATLRRCLAVAAAIPIHLSPAEAAGRLATAAVEIFSVPWCRLAEPDGRPIASAGKAPDHDPDGLRGTDAPLGMGTDGRRLEVGLSPGVTWTDGDQAGLEVMALLAGTVIVEAEQYGRAAGRADRLDRRNRIQREFLRSVSHNLRAPLATIELAASDLIDLDGDAYVRSRAEAIRIEERRLARLVGQVLILSRMETGTLHLDGEPVALGPLARRIATELGIEDLVAVAVVGDGDVAFTDPAAAEQITWILLDNAARYAPDRPIHVEIAVERDAAEPMLVLAIEDEGPGVAPGEERRIFRRFVRGSAARGVEGTGLGLSVARGLARALGGDVRYRTGAIGARFEVTLPYGGGAADDPDDEPAPPRETAAPR